MEIKTTAKLSLTIYTLKTTPTEPNAEYIADEQARYVIPAQRPGVFAHCPGNGMLRS